jgi:DnaJ-class molecular chaperone
MKNKYTICSKCNGERVSIAYCREDSLYFKYYEICHKCLGKGEVLWIDNITGGDTKINPNLIISYIVNRSERTQTVQIKPYFRKKIDSKCYIDYYVDIVQLSYPEEFKTLIIEDALRIYNISYHIKPKPFFKKLGYMKHKKET